MLLAKPKRTAAASRGFLATARLSCWNFFISAVSGKLGINSDKGSRRTSDESLHCLVKYWCQLSDKYILQGTVSKRLRWGGTFNNTLLLIYSCVRQWKKLENRWINYFDKVTRFEHILANVPRRLKSVVTLCSFSWVIVEHFSVSISSPCLLLLLVLLIIKCI